MSKNNNMTQIIAFVGFKQVGKSTAAKYLEDKYGFVRHNFKDALVAELKEKFPDLLDAILKTYQMLYYAEKYEYFITTIDELFIIKPPLMRALMQNYGTEVRRVEQPNYWVNQWEKEYMIQSTRKFKFVVDDVRFLNEAYSIKRHDGIIIRLTRPDLPSGGDHSSETEQLQIEADYTIECEAGDFEKLYTELDRIVHENR